ncbi:hypothetical protein Acr_28g0013400 [Actinidia rufa]|uniref:Uncharacterized protein n=1 Tax=Actinidia rufa TaxID=165716 RepID=A0A7J0HCD6_9ERIC|nr:hypothetical protein Acr_28g0013400 [Actinidia rufa]
MTGSLLSNVLKHLPIYYVRWVDITPGPGLSSGKALIVYPTGVVPTGVHSCECVGTDILIVTGFYISEPCYLGDPELRPSPDFSRICSQPNTSMNYQVYNSKMSSQDADLEGNSFTIMRRFDHWESFLGHQPKPKPILPNHTNPFPGLNSSIEMNEASAGEISVYGSCKMRAKPDLEGRIRVSVSGHHLRPCGYQVTGGQRDEPWLCNTYDVTTKDAHRECFASKYSNLTRKTRESLDMEDRALSRRMAKAANGDWDGFPQQVCAKEALMGEGRPWTNTIKRLGTFEILVSLEDLLVALFGCFCICGFKMKGFGTKSEGMYNPMGLEWTTGHPVSVRMRPQKLVLPWIEKSASDWEKS